MKKLLLIDFGAVWGGQEIYSRSIAQVLVERGWCVTSVSMHERHAVDGVRFLPVSIGYKDFVGNKRLIEDMLPSYDVVHFNGIRAIYLAAILKHSKPFVGTKHLPYSSLEQVTVRSWLARLGSHVVFHNLDRLISISEKTLVELPLDVQRRSSVVLNGVSDMGGALAVLPNEAELTVCFVGRFVEHKGLMRLLAAVALLRQQQVSVKVLLAGGGPLEQTAREFVASNHLLEAVEFLGYVESPADVFQRAHVCALPSLHEGLPLSLLEALSAHCALLGHDIPGVRDVINDGVNGLIAAISAESIADKLRTLAQNRSLLGKLRQNAREDYEKNWRLDRMVDETVEIYNRAVSTFEHRNR